jgi:hypothetical protein
MYLLCLLLKPMTGEVNARLLSAGVIVAVNFIAIESLRSQAGFGVDRLLTPARLIYFAASVLVLPATQICCSRLSRERPIGRRRSRHTSFPSR